ncbi:MAG: hypothetical protein AAB488_02640 [Patescibacteria group bacterium]
MRTMEQESFEPEQEIITTNNIQVELARRHNEELDDFIALHLDDFRKTVNEHPELVSQFEEDPDGTLEQIDEYLDH